MPFQWEKTFTKDPCLRESKLTSEYSSHVLPELHTLGLFYRQGMLHLS